MPRLPALRPVPKDAATCESRGDARLATVQVVLHRDGARRVVLFLVRAAHLLADCRLCLAYRPPGTVPGPSRIPPGAGIPLPAASVSLLGHGCFHHHVG